jgi:hypothetical protein
MDYFEVGYRSVMLVLLYLVSRFVPTEHEVSLSC